MLNDPLNQEIIALLREIVDLHRRDNAMRTEVLKGTKASADESMQYLEERKQWAIEQRRERDQEIQVQKAFRDQVLQELLKQSELLTRILARLSDHPMTEEG